MTTYYYSLDVVIENYIGDSDPMNQIPKTVIRTIPIKEQVSIKGKSEIIRDNFTEDYFDANKEMLSSKAITDYNKTHKSHVARITGIRRTPIMENIK